MLETSHTISGDQKSSRDSIKKKNNNNLQEECCALLAVIKIGLKSPSFNQLRLI
jgi:hypothetical protein